MHIYHYAAYEKSALLRLAARHGVGEQTVDTLLSENVLVDLYPIVRACLRIGQRSYSIKKLEPLYMGEHGRDGDVTNAAASVVAAYRKSIEERPDLYGEVQYVSFGPHSPPLTPPGTSDMVLFLQTVHAWMAAGLAEKAFEDAYTALKPGGVLGIEAHRGMPGGPQDPLAADGYVQEAYMKQLAEEAGFRFDKASEINANLNDDHDHPFGVWTLQPERRSAAPGQPEDPDFDRATYDAIGESDRMTLRFIKPI